MTIVPALCSVLVRGPFHAEGRNPLMKLLLGLYDPILRWALCWRKTVLACAAFLLASALVLALGLPRAVVRKACELV